MGMLLTGRQITAHEALDYGLVNQVVPGAQLDSAVEEWVGDMLACAPLALRATKQVARRNLDYATLAEAILAEYPAAAAMLASADAEEGTDCLCGEASPALAGALNRSDRRSV